MIIDIDYKLTIQDDLDNIETNQEYSFNRPWIKYTFFRGVPAFLVLLGLFCVIDGFIERDDPNTILAIIIGVVLIIVGLIFPLCFNPKLAQSKLSRRNLQKEWDKKQTEEEYRHLIITETEFIFKTEFSELAWTWQAFEKYFEGNKGFIFWFFSGDSLYIPKRIFLNKEQIDHFKLILETNASSTNSSLI